MAGIEDSHESNLFRSAVALHHKAVLRSIPGFQSMAQKLMDVLRLGRCSHEFSWPRRAADGHYYQVCLLCAAEYKYDWTTMRRTERVPLTVTEPGTRRRPRERKSTWVPRARRLKLDLPVRYRVKNTILWTEGTICNISQSGVLFQGEAEIPANALIELVFEMPEEISGQKNSQVLCQGRVIRFKDSHDREEGSTVAASILDYKFIHQS